MKPYFPTESNRYAMAVKKQVAAGHDTGAIYLNSGWPYKLAGVCGSFADSASGTLEIKVIRNGVEFLVFSQEFSGAKTFVLTDINVWLNTNSMNKQAFLPVLDAGTDVVVIDNQTNKDLTAILDFAY